MAAKMPADTPVRTLTPAAARAITLEAQGLTPSGPPSATLPEVVERHGPARTLGGSDAYLALLARRPGLSREEVDAAVAAGELKVTPAARGCIYLASRKQAPIALRVAERLSAKRAAREHRKAGIRQGELEKLGAMLKKALAERGPSTTDELRRSLPRGAVRSLGEPGRKVGISSTLPPALRRLEFRGEVERTPDGHRLDTERYLWRLPERNPFAGVRLPEDPAQLFAELGEIFFRAAGLASLEQFAAWAGCGKREARAAIDHLELVPVAVEGSDALLWVPPIHRDRVEDPPSMAGQAALLPFEDNALALHGGPRFLADPEHHGIRVPAWGRSGSAPLGQATHVFRAVLADGSLAGFWEFDPERREVVTGLFAEPSAAAARRIEADAERLGSFLRDQIGHARSFSIDTDRALARRAAEVRAL